MEEGTETAKAEYSSIATNYKDRRAGSKLRDLCDIAFRKLVGIEKNEVKGLAGLKVLDLGCGEGHYCRMWKREGGADEVFGVDLSEKMIGLAISQEEKQPMGITYSVGDAKNDDVIIGGGGFDLITAGYLFCHATCKDEALRFAQTIARNLKPGGGRLVTLLPRMELFQLEDYNPEDYRKYNFTLTTENNKEPQEGDKVILSIFPRNNKNEERETKSESGNKNEQEKVKPDMQITNYFLRHETYEAALKEAGLDEIRFVLPTEIEGVVDESMKDEDEEGRQWFQTYLNRPTSIFITAVKKN